MRHLLPFVAKFPKARVMVVGDLILDEYIWGNVERISPEAPVPVVWANKRTHVPGGAANVAHNIRALDGRVLLVGVTGKDKNRDILVEELRQRGVSDAGIFAEPSRHTTLKSRIIGNHQQVVRVDWEHTEPLPNRLNGKIADFVKHNIGKVDAVVIEDYGKGVINIELLQHIVGLARSRGTIVTVDPKEEHFQYYRGVTTITPNRKELENAVRNLRIKDTTNRFHVHNDRLVADKDIDAAARGVMEYLDLESVLVTLGERGMKLFSRREPSVHIPTVAQEVFDVSGAGDTVIAVFTLTLCAGASKLEAAHLANVAAGVVVGKVGTAVTSRKELSERIPKVWK